MPAPRNLIHRLLFSLALVTLAAPLFAEGCQGETYNCPNNADQCRWESCVKNGVEVFFLKKWCDGQIQIIEHGRAWVGQEEPCEEGSGDDQPGEKHPLYHLSSPW